MSEPKTTIGEILTEYFLNSQESYAVAFRNQFKTSKQQINQEENSCSGCPANVNSPLDDRLEDWLDNQDVMQILHISPRTLQTLRSNGILPFSRIGNKIYYRRSDISRILNNHYTMVKIKCYGSNK
jgi:hypothetical protein